MKTISRYELDLALSADGGPVLIDVMPAEAFARQHIPGAKNACVYEVGFLDQAAKVAPDKRTKTIVYGSGERNRASLDAAEKLTAAGYADVADFRGGLAEWFGKDALPEPQPVVPDRAHVLDAAKSKVFWTGRSLSGEHHGTVKLLQGVLNFVGGRPAGASFTLDMTSIENTDIPDPAMRAVLEAHLKSGDFFAAQKYPTATFDLSRITATGDSTPGRPSHQIIGALTMKGVSREITFPALIAAKPDGALAAEAHFDIDRTRWNVFYGSGHFYEQLGKHLVYDEITLGFHLVFV